MKKQVELVAKMKDLENSKMDKIEEKVEEHREVNGLANTTVTIDSKGIIPTEVVKEVVSTEKANDTIKTTPVIEEIIENKTANDPIIVIKEESKEPLKANNE